MFLTIEDKTTEYYIVSVESHRYEWHPETMLITDLWAQIDAWCEQTFGCPGAWGGPISAWKRMGPRYFFQFKKDREWFVLRWS